jgi:ABC-2 type transport system ATP-binding protein
MTPLLEVRGLKKIYDKSVEAVRGIDFSVKVGECVGLLGPNGAGKTTTLEMIEGVTQPSSGQILFEGLALSKKSRERLGIQFQATELLQRLSVLETIQTFGRLYKNPIPTLELIKICQLDDILSQRSTKLSGGQKQRLLLALALINNPTLIFLDEPTTGLDPQARRNVWTAIQNIKTQKAKTLILTTHYLEEAYLLCDRILIMNKGKIIAEGAPDELLKKHFEGCTIVLRGALPANLKLPSGTQRLPSPDGRVELFTRDTAGMMQALLDSKADLAGLEIRTPTLEDLFLKITKDS